MKKTVAVVFVFFALAMSVMLGWGFFDKQSKESKTNTSPAPMQTNNNSASSSAGSQNTTQPSTNTGNTYSKSQLATHNKPADCWLGINGNVYNVTNYVDMHPGGADLILMYCGKDATQAYSTQGGRGRGHSSRADAQLAEYKVGTLQ